MKLTFTTTLWPARPAVLLAAVLSLLAPSFARAEPRPGQLHKLYALVVIDTQSNLMPAVAVDKAMILGTLANNIPSARREVTVFEGDDVTPEKILAYFNNVKAGPDDAVLFYYTGHGATERKRGHVLTMGKNGSKLLFRSDLVAAMKAKNAGLTVLLTDCCSNVIDLKTPKKPGVFGAASPSDITPIVSALFFESRGVVDVTAAEYDTSAWCTEETGSFFTKALAELIASGKARTTWQDFFPQLQEETKGIFATWRKQKIESGETIPQESQVPTAFELPGGLVSPVRGWKLGARVSLQPGGIRIEAVTPGGPGDRAGLEAGDVISAINGRPLGSLKEYADLLDGSGGRVRLTLLDHRTNKTYYPNIRLEPQQP